MRVVLLARDVSSNDTAEMLVVVVELLAVVELVALDVPFAAVLEFVDTEDIVEVAVTLVLVVLLETEVKATEATEVLVLALVLLTVVEVA